MSVHPVNPPPYSKHDIAYPSHPQPPPPVQQVYPAQQAQQGVVLVPAAVQPTPVAVVPMHQGYAGSPQHRGGRRRGRGGGGVCCCVCCCPGNAVVHKDEIYKYKQINSF